MQQRYRWYLLTGVGLLFAVGTATAATGGGGGPSTAFTMERFVTHWWVFPASIVFSTIALASGVSGALFFSPFFMLGVGLAPAQAIGAGLLTEVFGMGNGLRSYVKQGVVDYQTAPVSDLMSQPPERKPDELWIIQINPQELDGEPTSIDEIADRRNELSGNISLNQELGFIRQINEWVEDGTLPEDEFSQTEIHRIEMGERFHCSTKLDRDPDFLAELMDLGRVRDPVR